MRQTIYVAIGILAIDTVNAEWSSYGADHGGTRFTSSTQITPGNISDLDLAWTFRTKHPVCVNGRNDKKVRQEIFAKFVEKFNRYVAKIVLAAHESVYHFADRHHAAGMQY